MKTAKGNPAVITANALRGDRRLSNRARSQADRIGPGPTNPVWAALLERAGGSLQASCGHQFGKGKMRGCGVVT